MVVIRVNNLAQTASWNLQKTNIRVNSICPGLIEVSQQALYFFFTTWFSSSVHSARLRLHPFSVTTQLIGLVIFLYRA